MRARNVGVCEAWKVASALICGALMWTDADADDGKPQTIATYTARVKKGGCEEFVAVGPTFHGPTFATKERPSATRLAYDACKQAHPDAFCALHEIDDTGQAQVMAAASFDQRCYDGGTITKIGIGFGATSEEAWQRATAELAVRSNYRPSKDSYHKREERAVTSPRATPSTAARPLASDEWSCLDGRTPKLRHRRPHKSKKASTDRVLQATHADGSTITVSLSTVISDAYQITWGDCYKRKKVAELGSLTCPSPPALEAGKIVELAIDHDTLTAAMSKHLCGDTKVDPGLSQRVVAPISGVLKAVARFPCKVMACEPGPPAKSAGGGVRN